MSDELKPCPFCGGKAYIHEHYTFGGYVPNDYPHNEPLGYAIGCSKYDCRGKRENTGFMYDTEDQAIAAWNARADDAQVAANDNLPAETDISADGHACNDAMVDTRVDEFGADDDYERRMDELLCRLTNGKWSKSRSYSVDFMVSCVDEAYDEILDPPVESHYASRNTRADEPADCGTAEDGASQVPQSDSRERLEADVYQAAEEMDRFYCGEKFIDTRKIIGWLDRQASITERKCMERATSERVGWDCAECAEGLRKQVDSLTAERDELLAKVDELNASWRKSNDGWAEANAEAERWRQKCDRMQHVIDVQRDSFLKLERENRELQDVCGELERTLENMRGD